LVANPLRIMRRPADRGGIGLAAEARHWCLLWAARRHPSGVLKIVMAHVNDLRTKAITIMNQTAGPRKHGGIVRGGALPDS
jgi:hypothetical protein